MEVSLKDTIPYRYFFKKIRDKVYRFSQIGDEEWREDLMPFKHEPFVYWNEPKGTKTMTLFERFTIWFVDRLLRMMEGGEEMWMKNL